MKKILIFDTETNGLSFQRSVNSLSVLKADFDGKEFYNIQKESRYYFIKPGEYICQGAVDTHGLTEDIIREKRAGVNYPLYHHEDNFLYEQLADVDILIAHNMSFDSGFYPKIDKEFKNLKTFCTMKSKVAVDFCALPKYRKGKLLKTYKWPKLKEIANILKIEFDEGALHDSMVDVELTFEVLKKLMINDKTKDVIGELFK